MNCVTILAIIVCSLITHVDIYKDLIYLGSNQEYQLLCIIYLTVYVLHNFEMNKSKCGISY